MNQYNDGLADARRNIEQYNAVRVGMANMLLNKMAQPEFEFGGFRENGGPVTPGKVYVVGEKRPELFVPDAPREVAPMYESLGGASRLTPRFQDIFLNTRPRISTAEQLLQAAREKLMNAGAAARMKMREQEERGMRSYVPANPEAADLELTKRMLVAGNLPMPLATPMPTQLQQRPTGGVIASYGPQERVVTSRYGTGTATSNTRKPATFDGKTKAQFFGQAAARQWVDNKYARAEKTGKIDQKTGKPIYTSKPIPKGSDAGTERVLEAMKKGGEKEKKKKAV
jgi:hypothetical protein